MKILKVLFIISLLNFIIFLLLSVSPTRSKSSPNRQTSLKITSVSPTPTGVSKLSGKLSPIVVKQSDLPSPTPDNRCLIVVDGKKYDVSSFKNIHSGGDIFKCGQDMTSIFYQQHPDSYLADLQKYQIQ